MAAWKQEQLPDALQDEPLIEVTATTQVPVPTCVYPLTRPRAVPLALWSDLSPLPDEHCNLTSRCGMADAVEVMALADVEADQPEQFLSRKPSYPIGMVTREVTEFSPHLYYARYRPIAPRLAGARDLASGQVSGKWASPLAAVSCSARLLSARVTAMTDTVVATISLARTVEEEAIILSSLTVLASLGLPVIIADGGSSENLLQSLRSLPLTTVLRVAERQSGLVSQVQAAVSAACETGATWILYTEPDKQPFFGPPLQSLVSAPKQDLAVLIPARDERSFATFPDGQQLTETLLNTLCGQVFGLAGDYSYGPLLMKADAAAFVPEIVEGDLGWGWRTFVLAAAYSVGGKLGLHTEHLPCPDDQRDEDDTSGRIYRMEQLRGQWQILALASASSRKAILRWSKALSTACLREPRSG